MDLFVAAKDLENRVDMAMADIFRQPLPSDRPLVEEINPDDVDPTD
jgi:hypothetical protein